MNLLPARAESTPPYYPQMAKGKPYKAQRAGATSNYGKHERVTTVSNGDRYPRTDLQFDCETGLHPTQKPVALFEYLIRTYTKAGELVLDPCVGSGRGVKSNRVDVV